MPPGGHFPPGGSTPWAGAGGGGWTWNRGRTLTRTRQGKFIAGVCAGLGRSTGVDPILFRVILAVLVFFGGIGALLYLVAWLVLPVDDEPASPIESLLGRGRSGTSPALTVGLIVLAALVLVGSLNNGFQATLLLAACVMGGVLLLRRTGHHNGYPAAPVGVGPAADPTLGFASPTFPTPPTAPPAPPAPQAAPAEQAAWAAAATTPVAATMPTATADPYLPPTASVPPTPSVPPSVSVPPAATPFAASAPPTPFPASVPPYTPPHADPYGTPGGTYTAPFAPYGPYGPYGGGATPPMHVVPPVPPMPPKRPKERSVLGRLTFSVACLAIVILVIINAAGGNIPFTGFVALALGIVAAGLLIGAWVGRARWLIPLGVLLTFALGIGSIAENVDGGPSNDGRDVTHRPTSVAEVLPTYEFGAGDFELDLTAVDFTGTTKTIVVNSGFGDSQILLPEDVDVRIEYDLGAGDAQILDRRDEGLGVHGIQIDEGENGPDTSNLKLVIHHGAGDLEVTR
ncbi:hypothetical protein GCM10020369_19340 [Cryptosporangium minutisporangium]|uniref:PspC domain-containing protein n=2 Tax=Cryptosporangium minutisporangium TaxID=113569 RepID=A0ABP6SUY5_9ACTN